MQINFKTFYGHFLVEYDLINIAILSEEVNLTLPCKCCRSFAFAIRPRPPGTEGRTISNLNVRGKRGNIVQVYPSVEYDFVPNSLEMGTSNYVHIQ